MHVDTIEKIIRTKRKTVALQIAENGALIVKAPLNITDDEIHRIISKHSRWIEKRKKQIQLRNLMSFKKKKFINGEGFLYLGKYYKLFIVENQSEPLRFYDGFYLSKDVLSSAREIFIAFYKKMAYQKISERVNFYATKLNLRFNKIRINNAKTRWGSCSSKGNLNFSWRLVMAPMSVIDYVVVHELVHLIEKNHGKEFWAKVRSVLPDYKERADWLKQNSYILRLE